MAATAASTSTDEPTRLDAWHGDDSSGERRTVATGPPAQRGSQGLHRLWTSVQNFWTRQITPTVSHEACRDHFANERTFLDYLRTSLALSFLSALIAQLYRIQHDTNPDSTLGYFVLGKPLACICAGAAILVAGLGGYRSWRQQNAMLRGRVLAGGWEINVMGMTIFVVTLTIFVLLITVAVRKDLQGED